MNTESCCSNKNIPALVNMLIKAVKKLVDLFRFEEVEITFDEDKKHYTYIVANDKDYEIQP